MDNLLQQLKNIYVTLNEVTIKGDQNISYMFGSLSTLAKLIEELSNNQDKSSNK